MDTRKVTLVATIVVIALLAVGIGYAYTASTQNSDNDVGSEYLTIVPTSNGSTQIYSGSFDKAIAYDTVKIAGATQYSITDSMVENITVAQQTTRELCKVGTLYLIIDQQHSEATDYDFSMTKTAGTMATSDFVYYISTQKANGATAAAAVEAVNSTVTPVAPVYNAFDPTSGVTISDIPKTNNFTVVKINLYVGLTTDVVEKTDSAGAPAVMPTAIMTGVTFNFVATAADPITPNPYPPTP